MGEILGLVHSVDGLLERREFRRALDKASHIPVAGTSAVPTPNANLKVELLLRGGAIVLRAMDVRYTYFLLIPERPKNSHEAWGVFRISRIATFGRPKRMHMDGGGEFGASR